MGEGSNIYYYHEDYNSFQTDDRDEIPKIMKEVERIQKEDEKAAKKAAALKAKEEKRKQKEEAKAGLCSCSNRPGLDRATPTDPCGLSDGSRKTREEAPAAWLGGSR